MNERGNPLSTRLILGLVLVALGALWTLDNLGLVDASAILRWWPAILVAVGLMKVTGIGMRRTTASGWLFTFAGSVMLMNAAHVIHFGLAQFWPVFLIFAGLQVVFRAWRRGGDASGTATDSDDWVHGFALMGGFSRRNQSERFRGGDLFAMMGGIELDLNGATPADGQAVIEVFAMWGGIEIFVPDNWRVVSEAVPIMGAVQDSTRFADDQPLAGTLVVRGLVMMGGVEVKNGEMKEHGEVYVRSTRRRGDRVVRKIVKVGPGIGVIVQRDEKPADEKPE